MRFLLEKGVIRVEKPMVEYFLSCLSQVSLLPDKEDLWLWSDPPSYSFSVKSTYKKLANHEIEGVIVSFAHLWNLKVMPSV